MTGITRRHARIMRRQIRKQYGSNFIPVLVNSPISIGDILTDPKEISPVYDSSVFPEELIKISEGPKNSTNIVSDSTIELSIKAKGENNLEKYFQLGEAGMAITFSDENQLFLKLQGTCIKTINNLPAFRRYFLENYSTGVLNGNIYVVTSIIWSDKYFLQFSSQKGGTLAFELKVKPKQAEIQANADFNFKWSEKVGYSVDGSNGGVLGYKVSALRLKNTQQDDDVFAKLRSGLPESDALSRVAVNDRKILLESDKLDIQDVTSQVILDMEDELA